MVIRISTALADPKTTADHVVTIVGAEPRLAARILQTANSAAFNTSGKRLTDIAVALSLSVKTVSVYRTRLLEKMKLRNNAELTFYVMSNRLVDLNPAMAG